MLSFLVYEGKVAMAMAVFYMFYRLLLKKETFHRFNRVALVSMAVLSFILPLCIITIHKPMEAVPIEMGSIVVSDGAPAAGAVEAPSRPWWSPWWSLTIILVFWAGAAFVLIRAAASILSILRIVRNGACVGEEEGCRIFVTERDIDPFSWMRYIVLSRKDWEGPHAPVITHEKAHIGYGHSVDLLLVNVLSAFQWFNPAIWMLRADLQELHEYEADDAVLRSGANIKDYQYLLIRKAVGKSGYSVANSFNHSILKNRITMMSKSKSPLRRGLRVLYLLPLVCLGIGLQAKTVYVPDDKVNQNDGKSNVRNEILVLPDGASPLFILRQAWGEEKELAREEFDRLDTRRIQSIQILKDAAAREKYGDKAADGVVIITLKRPQDLEEIVVVRQGEKSDEPVPFFLVEPETMPTFQGGDMNDFTRWLNDRIRVPKGCNHSGTVKVGFVVAEDGSVKDVQIMQSVCEELDALMLDLVAKSPKWEPATSGGRAVAQFLTVPIKFAVR